MTVRVGLGKQQFLAAEKKIFLKVSYPVSAGGLYFLLLANACDYVLFGCCIESDTDG